MCSFASAQETSITLSHVDTLIDGELQYNQPIAFYFRITNQSTHDIFGSANGFRIYSPDGATWYPGIGHIDTIYCDPFPCPGGYVFDTVFYGDFLNSALPGPLVWKGSSPQIYDGGIFVDVHSVDGQGADTVLFAGYTLSVGLGLYSGFDAVGWLIRLGGIPEESVGKTICLDSSYVPPSGRWLWTNDTAIYPDWDGPHCYVVGDCCHGMRGNIAGNDGPIDVADLTTLAHYMFGNDPAKSLPCLLEANVNGDAEGSIDISDLTRLVGYMFRHGPAPADCP